MNKIIQSKFSKVDRIMAFLMLSAGIYVMIESPSIMGGVFLFCMLVVIFFTFTCDEVVFDETGDGVVESKIWTLIGVKKYRYQGLAKAKAVITEDIGSESPIINNYLLFDDGHKLFLPIGKKIPEEVKAWFKNKYNIELEIIAPKVLSKSENVIASTVVVVIVLLFLAAVFLSSQK